VNGPLHCDPESVFELADGSLGSEREREIRAHLRGCSSCRTLYERELRLNASLSSLELEETNSVCRSVAMALPTRSTKARFLWDVIQVVFASIGQALLIALTIGAFVDLVIAAVYLAVSRRRAREA
jgi:predicted anti-sigma-YlaC factor YlaD